MASNIKILILFYQLYYDNNNKPSKSKNHTGISFVTWFCRESNHLLGIKIQNSVRITEGSDNGDLDSWGSTVYHNTVGSLSFWAVGVCHSRYVFAEEMQYYSFKRENISWCVINGVIFIQALALVA